MALYAFIAVFFIVSVVLAYYFAPLQNSLVAPVGLRVDEVRSNYDMADLITYRVSAGAPVSGDVVSRLVTIVVDAVPQGTTSYAGTVIDFGNITVPQDSNVEVQLVDVDDAGNKSAPASISFVAADTIPPAQPGFLGVTIVGETHETDSDVVPPAEEPEDAAPEPEVQPEPEESSEAADETTS